MSYIIYYIVGDMMHLNDEQKKVIESDNRFLFLLAGAGSGKTRVIVEKIKYVIESGINPKEILAITFTRKSAHEMKERIKNSDIDIHTFHQFCLIKLQDLGYPYKIIDEEKIPFNQEQLLKITRYKNSLYRKRKPFIYDKYQAYLNGNQLKDFDDLLHDFIKRVQLKTYKPAYKYIFIDEFQDTNLLQYEVLKKMIIKETCVLAVGDPDQSIYAFRGAQSKIITQYVKDYQAMIFTLQTNYRSSPEIIMCANRLISINNRKYKKNLISSQPSMELPSIYRHLNEKKESIWLIERIKSWTKQGYKYEDIAVLYRNHDRSYELRYQLDSKDIPYIKDKHMYDLSGIHLLTIHQAKGLEFKIVCIIGLENRVFPTSYVHTQSNVDEERRLMFVAMTRAKHQLIMSYVLEDSFNQRKKPSKFIKECRLKIQKIN